jgi:hypothetical protein
MGFWRQQEEKLAARLLQWHRARRGLPVMDDDALAHKARELVGEAHRVARVRGRNVLDILKELVEDIRR